ncbi:hypothetical protein WA158_003640 [Blastocystis sp. Blastoise]
MSYKSVRHTIDSDPENHLAPWIDNCSVVDDSSIAKLIDKSINRLKEDLAFTEGTSILYLILSNWRQGKVMDNYLDSNESFRKKNGFPKEDCEEFPDVCDCPICFETYPRDECVLMPCGHMFCKHCFESHLLSVMNNAFPSPIVTCLCTANSKACKCPINPDYILNLKNDSILSWYKKRIIQHYITFSPTLCACKNSNGKCTNIICRSATYTGAIYCPCGSFMCGMCKELYHEPIPCAMCSSFLDMMDNNKDQWLIERVKACPHCKCKIEKNEGCNHMICNNCNYQFCWVCMGDWSKHATTYYTCNRINDSHVQYETAKTLNSLVGDLDRTGFFVTRYKNHLESYKKNQTLLLHFVKDDYKSVFVNHLELAVQQVLYNHLILASTYIYAYNHVDNKQILDLFYDWQGRLEQNNEQLQDIILDLVDSMSYPSFMEQSDSFFNDKIHSLNSIVEKNYSFRTQVISAIKY